jgi:hypothetical protein
MSATPQPHDRRFDFSWPDWLPLPAADGLVAFLPGHRAATSWADKVLSRDEAGFTVWVATGGNPHLCLPLVSLRSGVQAISVAPAGEDPRRIHLALQVACHLATEAFTDDSLGLVRTTSPCVFDARNDHMSVPHLVTLRSADGIETDAAVWESLTAKAATRWLSEPLPDPALVEANLPTLLRLRTATRTRRIPAGLAPPLAALLNDLQSPLSIKQVCRHADLFLGHSAAISGGEA